ncbi:MAG: AAA family ATPase, partial [Chloroflexi bacterium]|nr:AAA family ATPase [Chloroflexota bacterium]
MTDNMTTEELLQQAQMNTGDTPRYVLRSAFDALQPQPPIEWIVDKLFSAGSVSLVVGEAGSKKTWSLIDLAVAIANGETWLHFPTTPGAVLIVDEESGQRRLARRLGDALRGHDAGHATPLYYVSLAAFDFGKADDVNQLHSLITQTGARFVVIDALADVMPGRDENAVQFVQPVFIALRKVAELTQAAIVIIHHSNKAGGYRGSTAIKGAVDLMLQVESQPESPNIDFKTEKARD